jgi:hypothetical protein
MATQIRLKVLLHQRHWQTYRAFKTEYDRIARTIDGDLAGTWPSRAQLHRWLSGNVKRLPYPDHCRVLEAMFPGWNAQQLFEPADDSDPDDRPPTGTPTATSPLIAAITAGLHTPDTDRNEWGNRATPQLPGNLDPGPPPTDGDDDAYTLGRRLLATARVLRLDAAELGQLAALAGNVVNLALDVTIDLAADGTARVTYRHDLINLTTRPFARSAHELWFEHTDGSLRLAPVNHAGRITRISRVDNAPNLAHFACHLDPPVNPGDTVTIEFACDGPMFHKHYWRQAMMRYIRHLTIRLRVANATISRYTAIEESTDGTETDVTDSVIADTTGPDATLTVTRDYLRPNQFVTLRWEHHR